jgi:hypothetical protein
MPATGGADRACRRSGSGGNAACAGRAVPAAKLVGKLALGIGLVFVRSRPHPLAPHLRRALDRVSIQSGQRAAQLVEFDPFEHFIVVEQQFDLTRRVRFDRAFVRSFELELTC